MMNLVGMFCDDLNQYADKKDLVTLEVMLCIPAYTRQKLASKNIPCHLPGNICNGAKYTPINSVDDINFYIDNLNKIHQDGSAFLKVPIFINGSDIPLIKEISQTCNGRTVVDININTKLIPTEENPDICVSIIHSVTMYCKTTCLMLPDPLYIGI